jgi:hypothetical protein
MEGENTQEWESIIGQGMENRIPQAMERENPHGEEIRNPHHMIGCSFWLGCLHTQDQGRRYGEESHVPEDTTAETSRSYSIGNFEGVGD